MFKGRSMKCSRYASIFWQLLRVEFIIFKRTFVDKIINSLVWASTTIPITGYILPMFGLSQEFAAFFAASFGISCGWFEIYPQVANLLADMENERHIDYHLTLPLPGWMVFTKMACATTLSALLMNAVTLAVAKVMLWNILSFAHLSWWKLILALMVTSFFFGCFMVLMAGIVKNLESIGNVFMRLLHPMLFYGGFQFSWQAISSLVPSLGYVILLNPYIYASEGMRAAILGQDGYLPFWLCMLMLILFSLVFVWYGMIRLKRRLDFV
jgi:ABC-2 type transport system permease protein